MKTASVDYCGDNQHVFHERGRVRETETRHHVAESL
jgi:hypothetical protein